jgi:predicted alpha/beta superfamily hydrolase
MKTRPVFCIHHFLLLMSLCPNWSLGQEITIGFKDSIRSEVLDETRTLYISLPENYSSTGKSYPVLFRLDGSINLFTETAGVVRRLAYMEEVIPELIVVLIGNTDRNRDMIPVQSDFIHAEPGAEDFKRFLDKELIPHIERSYHTTGERILCGQSLSAIFTLYSLLTGPETFSSYIACSAGFLDREDYFFELTENLLKTKQPGSIKLFLSHGSKDYLDPSGTILQQLQHFTSVISSDEKLECKLQVYEDEGHVPYPSLYHGLKFIYE